MSSISCVHCIVSTLFLDLSNCQSKLLFDIELELVESRDEEPTDTGKTSGFLSRETGISGNFVGRIKCAKCPFDLQFLTWDFS